MEWCTRRLSIHTPLVSIAMGEPGPAIGAAGQNALDVRDHQLPMAPRDHHRHHDGLPGVPTDDEVQLLPGGRPPEHGLAAQDLGCMIVKRMGLGINS